MPAISIAEPVKKEIRPANKRCIYSRSSPCVSFQINPINMKYVSTNATRRNINVDSGISSPVGFKNANRIAISNIAAVTSLINREFIFCIL